MNQEQKPSPMDILEQIRELEEELRDVEWYATHCEPAEDEPWYCEECGEIHPDGKSCVATVPSTFGSIPATKSLPEPKNQSSECLKLISNLVWAGYKFHCALQDEEALISGHHTGPEPALWWYGIDLLISNELRFTR